MLERIFWYILKKTLNILTAINKPKALTNKIKTTVLVRGMHSFIAPTLVLVNMQVVDRCWLISKYDDIHWCHWPMSICCVSNILHWVHTVQPSSTQTAAITFSITLTSWCVHMLCIHQVCFQTKVKETDGGVGVLWATVLEKDQWIEVCKIYRWPVLVWLPWWGNQDIFSVDADKTTVWKPQRPCYQRL